MPGTGLCAGDSVETKMILCGLMSLLAWCRKCGTHTFFFFFNLFIYLLTIVTEREREREREAETQAEGEAGSMHRKPDMGFDPRSPGSRPGLKAVLNR